MVQTSSNCQPKLTDPALSPGAIYAVTSFLACVAPTMTFQLYGIIPVPAWLCAVGLFSYDVYSTYSGTVCCTLFNKAWSVILTTTRTDRQNRYNWTHRWNGFWCAILHLHASNRSPPPLLGMTKCFPKPHPSFTTPCNLFMTNRISLAREAQTEFLIQRTKMVYHRPVLRSLCRWPEYPLLEFQLHQVRETGIQKPSDCFVLLRREQSRRSRSYRPHVRDLQRP